MNKPISPPLHRGAARDELPAYVANGVIGLRVPAMPLLGGLALVNGYTGEHPERRIEAAAAAPYPLAADLCVAGVWLSEMPHAARALEQSYDFASGELRSRFEFAVKGCRVKVQVLTFASREEPSLVCQEIAIRVNRKSAVSVKLMVDGRSTEGRALRYMRDTPGEPDAACDGATLWEGAGALSRCGIAYVTQLLGVDAKAQRPPPENRCLSTRYDFPASTSKTFRVRHIASLIPSVTHEEPDFQAVRQVALAAKLGYEALRAANQAAWRELWKGRIVIHGADRRWQALSDAALFYLFSSTHVASPASTSIFGLASWHNYHYYYGHVMWDIETFVVPSLSLLRPHVAECLLNYRSGHLAGAARNARLRGRRGLQFPWESAPRSGEEAAPMPGTAAWHEDHVSLDVAHAFATHARVTGDSLFLRDKAWPVLRGVAEWITSRAVKTSRGFEIKRAMGIAERKEACDNAAFTNMSAILVLREAIGAAEKLGLEAGAKWRNIADNLVIPRRGPVVISHDGFGPREEKGATPDPLMGVFPLGFPLDPKSQAATLKFYLRLKKDYIGSPMLSALYGVWAAYSGDRALALKLLDEGYGQFCVGRFAQTLEYRPDAFPEQPRAGPFFANLGGFLMSLLLGFPGLQPTSGPIRTWYKRPVELPATWSRIEVERLFVRGQAHRLCAEQGAEHALLTPLDPAQRR